MSGMPTYIAFLRAVNVGKRQVKMASLREWLEEAGFTDVETYIQTGNVRLTTPSRSAATVEARLEALLAEKCGFDVPCIVFTPAELRQIHLDAAAIERPSYADRDDARRYVVFYKVAPDAEQSRALSEHRHETEAGWVIDRAAHVWIAGGMADAEIFTKHAKLFEPGTNRNFRVLSHLAERWGG